jgi:hypothetical protein
MHVVPHDTHLHIGSLIVGVDQIDLTGPFRGRVAHPTWMQPHRLSVASRSATVFLLIRVPPAWSPCRAPGLGLEQELVPPAVAELAGRLRFRIVEPALLVLPRPELATVVLTSWTELVEAP